MRAARIAIAAACLGPLLVACSSDDNSAPTATDGGDARAGDATTSDVAHDTVSGEASGDAVRDVAATDTGDARGPGDGGSPVDADAGGASDAPGPEATAPTIALLRVAHWSPDAPPLDACIAPHGTNAYQGPVAAALASSIQGDGGAAALTFPLASAYVNVAPGQYDVRIVAAGAGSCAVGIGRDATVLPALTAGASMTIAILGEVQPTGGDPGLRVVGFADDSSSAASGVALRFIHAAPALARVDVGTGSMADPKAKFQGLFQGVLFGQAATALQAKIGDAAAPSVDANGYQTMSQLSNATLSAHLSNGTTDAVVTTGLSVASGSVLTIALVGGTSSGVAPRLLQCVDNAGTVGPFSHCSLLP
jgi:hypothetical protein